VTLSIVIPAPTEPSRFGLLFIAGPWFFLGLQELLRYWPPFLAGVVAPLLPLGLLLWLPVESGRRRLFLGLIVLWLVLYAGLSWLCWQRI
jgi:ubiquinol-cytochrome c reductase cytochrome b subunit